MYRDDVAAQEARANALRTEVATLEGTLAELQRDAEEIEREASALAANRFGLLARWWAIGLVFVALGLGAFIGNQCGTGHRTEVRSCPTP